MPPRANSIVHASFCVTSAFHRISTIRYISIFIVSSISTRFRRIHLFRHNISPYKHTSDYCPTYSFNIHVILRHISHISNRTRHKAKYKLYSICRVRWAGGHLHSYLKSTSDGRPRMGRAIPGWVPYHRRWGGTKAAREGPTRGWADGNRVVGLQRWSSHTLSYKYSL